MGLRMKFNLVLSLATLVGLIATGIFGYEFLQEKAREEVLDTARLMMESALAVRSYTLTEVKPLLVVQQRRQFIPQTVPAYSASRYITFLQDKRTDYNYKEATLNPTNPANRVTQWESDIVYWFRNHNDQTELTGQRDTPSGPMLYLSRPIPINDEGCLACHGRPADAPATLIDSYGSSNGFGWKLHEIVGAQIVSVPMNVPIARAHSAFMVFMSAITIVFFVISLLLNLLLHYIVVKPVRAISTKADEISMGALKSGEFEVKGKDEIASLGRSFNRMHRSLANAVRILDDSMHEDTYHATPQQTPQQTPLQHQQAQHSPMHGASYPGAPFNNTQT